MTQDTLTHECETPLALASAKAHCELCESLHDDPEQSTAGTVGRSEKVESAAESIVDALGFCGYHGLLLTTQADRGITHMRTLRDATERVIELLSDEKRYADRLVEICFLAERSCPTCKVDDHRLKHHTNRLTERLESESSVSLCFPHYRAVTYAARPETLAALVGAQRALHEAVVGAVGAIPSGSHARTNHSSLLPATLRWALDVVAGQARPRQDLPVLYPAPEPGCPVCSEIVGAANHWIDAVKAAARLGQYLWTVFPTCPAHIRHCAALNDERIATLAARYAADVQVRALQRGVAALARDNEQRARAAKSVFYRRQSPAYVLGQQRKMITNIPRCPACERLIVARDRAIGSLVQKLRGSRGRSDRFSIPCLKHFAAVYIFLSEGDARDAFVANQLEVLHELHGKLKGATADAASSARAAIRVSVRQGISLWSAATPPTSAYS